MSQNKTKAQQYRQTEKYKQSRRVYNSLPEVKYHKKVRAAVKRKTKGM